MARCVLTDPLEALGLPDRLQRRLLKGPEFPSYPPSSPPRTILDLTEMTEAEILRHKGLGHLGLNTIIRILAAHGWKLGGIRRAE
jgi:hypothetical protein